jgi:NAD(P)H dehydrogenase (quinone)
MTLVITGATGHYGRLVVEALLALDVPADQIVAAGRNVGKIGDLADRGVAVRPIDYDDTESLRKTFAGADKVLLVSGATARVRVAQHRNAIDAAAAAGVGLLVYTSGVMADRSGIKLFADHRATETALAESRLPHTLLRHDWYLENYTGQLATYVQSGAVLGCADDGLVSAATRADLAEAAASVLLGDDQAGKVYELGGDDAFTLPELAQTVSEATGHAVTYRDLPAGEYTRILVQAGLPEGYAALLADGDLGIARGDLYVTTGDLSRLIGRSPISMREAVHRAATAASIGP